MNSLSIYVHYPFCKAKCPYCDFNSHVKNGVDNERFLQAYLRELEYFAVLTKNRQVRTIFFGGGTPSLMPIALVANIIEKIFQLWSVDKNCEITLEANPTSFEAAKFRDFKKAGINRLSIGIQALNDGDLKFLGREHSAAEAVATIKSAGEIFDNYSFDLIYARPNQTLDSWQKELEEALKLSASHLSLYQLTIEKGTKFYSQYQRGEFVLPDENLAADFYHLTNEITAAHSFEFYEISNYAKKTFECQHNLVYWQGLDYIGIGAGAHGRVYFDGKENRQATMMVHEPMKWLATVEESGVGLQNLQEVAGLELVEEILMMAFRIKGGLTNDILARHQVFKGKTVVNLFDQKKISYLLEQGFVILTENSIFIPKEKMVLANQIILKMLATVVL